MVGRFLAVVATQGVLTWIREAYREAVRPPFLRPSRPVSVFRRSSRSMSFVLGGPTPGMAGVGDPPLRALHIELSSTAKGPAATRGDDGRDFGVPKRNVL